MDTMELMDKMRTLLADGQRMDAALLLPYLVAAVTGDAGEELSTYPVCAACHGYAELAVPELGRNVSCQVEPIICPGNKHGRMSPAQFQAYMEAKLTGKALPEGVEEMKPVTVPDTPLHVGEASATALKTGPGLVEYLKRRAQRFKA